MHHVWDSSIAEKMVGGNRRKAYDNAFRWATDLTDEIKTGKYQAESAAWLDAMFLDDPVATSMAWANESNTYVCSHGEWQLPSNSMSFSERSWLAYLTSNSLPRGTRGYCGPGACGRILREGGACH